MHWHDIVTTAAGGGRWQGLGLSVDRADRPAGPPGFCIRARDGRIRIDVGPTPCLWASVNQWRLGVWTLVSGQESPSVLPPIQSRAIRAIAASPRSEDWWRLWAREFASRLGNSPRSPLYEGHWILSPTKCAEGHFAALLGQSLSSIGYLPFIHRVESCLEVPPIAWESWRQNGSCAALRLREPSDSGSARIKAFCKLARDGVMPPLLFLFVSGIDMFVLLDGHDRLRALLLEKAPIPLLVLKHVQASPREPDHARQAAIVREIARRSVSGASRNGPLPVPVANAHLIEAFDDRPRLFPRTRAFVLRGGAAAWTEEVRRTFGLSLGHPALLGEPPAT